jgi:hypothetical protein
MNYKMDLVVCTICDGLGHERRDYNSLPPWANVYGWHIDHSKGYMSRICKACNGEGFRFSGSLVPAVPKAANSMSD